MVLGCGGRLKHLYLVTTTLPSFTIEVTDLPKVNLHLEFCMKQVRMENKVVLLKVLLCRVYRVIWIPRLNVFIGFCYNVI